MISAPQRLYQSQMWYKRSVPATICVINQDFSLDYHIYSLVKLFVTLAAIHSLVSFGNGPIVFVNANYCTVFIHCHNDSVKLFSSKHVAKAATSQIHLLYHTFLSRKTNSRSSYYIFSLIDAILLHDTSCISPLSFAVRA